MLNLPPAILRWINMLRTTRLPQNHFGSFQGYVYDHKLKQQTMQKDYCALGILCLANGQPPRDPKSGIGGNWAYAREILGEDNLLAVYHRNDAKKLTFPEIADWAEVYFASHGPHITPTKEPTND